MLSIMFIVFFRALVNFGSLEQASNRVGVTLSDVATLLQFVLYELILSKDAECRTNMKD